MRLEEGINKMKTGIAQAGHANLQIRKPGLAMSIEVLEHTTTLLAWLRLHQQRSVPYTTVNMGITDMKALKRFLQPQLTRKRKSLT